MAPKKNAAKKPAQPRRIVISDDELESGITNLDNVQLGVEELQVQGFVIIENAIPNHIVARLEEQMQADTTTSLTFTDLVFNHGNERNNFSITPPLSDEFITEEIWANRHAVAIMQQVIGPRPINCWASSNIALQASANARQTVHSDAYADILDFPYAMEMNIYLQDTTVENGSTEIWPGSHVYKEDAHYPTGRGFISKKAFTERARTVPPIQPNFPLGSILIRDLRIWHSGMPNLTAIPRILVGFLYFPQWFRPLMRLTLPEEVRVKAEQWTHIDLITNTDFVEAPIDHLHTRFPLNFTQDPEKAMVPYRRRLDIQQGRMPGEPIVVTRDYYWEPSKYQTRKRKRDEEEVRKAEQAEAETGAGAEVGAEAEGEGQGTQTKSKGKNAKRKTKQKNTKQKTKSKVNQRAEAELEAGGGAELPQSGGQVGEAVQHSQKSLKPSYSEQRVDDLPDYLDSPSFSHESQKLQIDAARVEIPARYTWVSAVQRATFNLTSQPFTGSGPGISPEFSPKTIPETIAGSACTPESELKKRSLNRSTVTSEMSMESTKNEDEDNAEEWLSALEKEWGW